MMASILGALIGLSVGIADFYALRVAAQGRAGSRPAHGARGPLKVVAVLSIFVFPILGWFAGPIIAASLGG